MIYYPYPANDGKHKYYIVTADGKKMRIGPSQVLILLVGGVDGYYGKNQQ